MAGKDVTVSGGAVGEGDCAEFAAQRYEEKLPRSPWHLLGSFSFRSSGICGARPPRKLRGPSPDTTTPRPGCTPATGSDSFDPLCRYRPTGLIATRGTPLS